MEKAEAWDADSEERQLAGAYLDAKTKRDGEIKIAIADRRNLASWMSLVEIVRWNFPGLETEEKLEDYRNTVLKNMDRKTALCALDQNMVVGILLFFVRQNMLCCLAVHPKYRRRGIASRLIRRMLEQMDPSRDIIVETFREGDEKGVAARALYRSLGFVPEQDCIFEEGYPVQRFVRKAEGAERSAGKTQRSTGSAQCETGKTQCGTGKTQCQTAGNSEAHESGEV